MCVGTGTGWHEAQEAGPGLQASVPDPYSGHLHNRPIPLLRTNL